MSGSFVEHYGLSRNRFGRLLARGLLRSLHAIGQLICRVRIDILNRERLEIEGPVIMAANHCSLIDTPVLYLSIPAGLRHHTATVGGLDYFQALPGQPRLERWFRRSVIWFIRGSMSVLLIDRVQGEYDRVDRLGDVLSQGWSLMIFPEATRSRSGRIGRFRHGAAELAGRHQVSVIPIRIDGTDRVLPPGVGWPRSGRIVVAIGEPIQRKNDETASAFTARIRCEIEALGESQGCAAIAALESTA